jgi:hypothetical protein
VRYYFYNIAPNKYLEKDILPPYDEIGIGLSPQLKRAF